MCEALEDFGDVDKLGQDFTSSDPLEKVDIGDGTVPRLTFVNANLSDDCKADLIKLLKEYVDCFAWEYSEILGFSCDLVEHQLRLRPVLDPINNLLAILIPLCMTEKKKKSIVY